MNRRAAETDLRLKRLYDAIVSDVTDLSDPPLKDFIVPAGVRDICNIPVPVKAKP